MAWWPRPAEDGQLADEGRMGATHAGLGRRVPASTRWSGQRRDARHIDLVVARKTRTLAQFAEVLHQAEGERIVVVDHQQHGRSSGSRPRRRRWHRSWSASQHLERAANPGGTNSASPGPASLERAVVRVPRQRPLQHATSCSSRPNAPVDGLNAGEACRSPAARRRSRFRASGCRAAGVPVSGGRSAHLHHGAELGAVRRHLRNPPRPARRRGSARALVLGLLPFHLGTESATTPAAACVRTGCRP